AGAGAGAGATGVATGAGVANAELGTDVADALCDADVVVVENVCSLPLNPEAAAAIAGALRGRPAILHHHDLPWQRPRFTGCPPPPDDDAWRHVTINWLSRGQLASHDIEATVVYNAFDPDPPPGRRDATRTALGVAPGELLVLQPTRALERKRVGAAIDLAAELGATFWLLGPPEDGYGPTLDGLLAEARCPVRTGPVALDGRRGTIHDAYAACDVVALPSSWEGFGNPALESATHRRPLFVGDYPVARELEGFGFEWFFDTSGDRAHLAAWLEAPDDALLSTNAAIAGRFFSLADLPRRVRTILGTM
ncbi:MAG: glycosyltransferase, partial [Acidimicrobiales bacterium]